MWLLALSCVATSRALITPTIRLTSRALIAPTIRLAPRRTGFAPLRAENPLDALERSWSISRDPEQSEVYQEVLAAAATATAACWALALMTLALSPQRRQATAAHVAARLANTSGWRGVAATWVALSKWVAAPPLLGTLLALGARGVRRGVGMPTQRWHKLATTPLSIAFLPVSIVLYLDAVRGPRP